MTDEKETISKETLREKLEFDVLKISDPKGREVEIDTDKGVIKFKIIPLSVEDLQNSEERIRKVIESFTELNTLVTDVVSSIKDSRKDSEKEMEVIDLIDILITELSDASKLIGLGDKGIEVVKNIIEIGSTAKWEDLKSLSIWTVAKIVKEIIGHNYTDRLTGFLE